MVDILSLLPIVLFVLTLLIVFLLRAKDKRESKLPMVKRMADQTIGEIEKIDSQFKQDITDIEVKIADKENELKEHLSEVDAKIKEIDSYSDDLTRIKASMDTYQGALEGLAKLTINADEKLKQLETDIQKLSEVKAMIDEFKSSISRIESDAENLLEATKRRVLAEIEDAVKSVPVKETKLEEPIEDSEPEFNSEPEPEPEPELEPEPEQEEKSEVEYTGEEEEVVFD